MMKKRWGYAAIGVIVMLFAGLVYAWSVISLPISAYFPEYSKAQMSFTFTLAMMFFCIGGLIAGILSKKTSPRMLLIVTGISFGVGFLLASQANSLFLLYLGYGVFAGLGSGFAYNVILGISNRWFADMPGLISGIVLMGFGFGSFFIGKIYQAYTPAGAGVDAFRTSFIVMAAILFVSMLVAAFTLRGPKDEEEEQIRKLVDAKKEQAAKNNKKQGVVAEVGSVDFTPAQMLKTSGFWVFLVWTTVLSSVGLVLISQASGIVVEVNASFVPSTIATIVGLISIFNGAGRVMFGRMYDTVGQRKTMLLVEVIFTIGIGLLALALSTHASILLIIGFIVMGIGYGGVTPTNSAFTNDFYGRKNYSINMPIVTMNIMISAFSSTLSGALYDATKSYFSTLILLMGFVVVGVISTLLIRRPKEV